MTNYEKKQWLSRAFLIDKRIKYKFKHIESLRNLATTASQKLNETSDIHSGYESSKVEEYAVKIADLETELKMDIMELADTKREVMAAIKSVTNPEASMVLELRYLNMKSWEYISEEMHYASGYVYKVHRRALDILVI